MTGGANKDIGTFTGVRNRGILYVATGERFIEEMLVSVVSVKRHMPEIPVAVFSDRDIAHPAVDKVFHIEDPVFNIIDKPRHILHTPFDRTLFLDTDTWVCDDLLPLFDLLDRFDIAASHAPVRTSAVLDSVPDAFPEFNAGVILFRREQRVMDVLRRWRDGCDEYFAGKTWTAPPHIRQSIEMPVRDQPSLRKVLYHCDLRIATLPPEYNCRFIYPGALFDRAVILHGRTRYTCSFDDVARALNRDSGRVRVHNSVFGEMHVELPLGWNIRATLKRVHRLPGAIGLLNIIRHFTGFVFHVTRKWLGRSVGKIGA